MNSLIVGSVETKMMEHDSSFDHRRRNRPVGGACRQRRRGYAGAAFQGGCGDVVRLPLL
jgi:hypothetical protein